MNSTRKHTYTSHGLHGGIWEDTRKITVTRPLEAMPYAQAGILERTTGEDGALLILYSYATPAAVYYTATGNVLPLIAPDYSRSTGRHFGAFMREISGGRYGYHDIKAAWKNRAVFNVRTGATAPRTDDAELVQDYALRA